MGTQVTIDGDIKMKDDRYDRQTGSHSKTTFLTSALSTSTRCQ